MSENRQSRKYVSYSGLPVLVEEKAFNEILLGVVKYLDSHDTFLRISALASSHVTNRAVPSATRWSALRRESPGANPETGTASGERAKSSHSNSMASSFSWTVISSNGSETAIQL